MKKTIILIVALLISAASFAQQCYNTNFNAGKTEYDNGNYEKAIEYFETAKKCPDRQGVTGANNWIINCNFAIFGNCDMEMVYVEGGEFMMGCTEEQGDDCWECEKPVHKTTISDFYIGKYEVTVEQFAKFVDETNYKTDAEKKGKSLCFNNEKWGSKKGAYWKCGINGELLKESQYNNPVVHISWNDALVYCEWLSQRTNKNYRLPTEAEWEFAARGGNRTKYYMCSGSNNSDNVAWYRHNSGSAIHIGGKKAPNELGIFDMIGNVSEWCSDWYDSKYYSSSGNKNPKGPSTGSEKTVRGNGWYSITGRCHISFRSSNIPEFSGSHHGFRVVLEPKY